MIILFMVKENEKALLEDVHRKDSEALSGCKGRFNNIVRLVIYHERGLKCVLFRTTMRAEKRW